MDNVALKEKLKRHIGEWRRTHDDYVSTDDMILRDILNALGIKTGATVTVVNNQSNDSSVTIHIEFKPDKTLAPVKKKRGRRLK